MRQATRDKIQKEIKALDKKIAKAQVKIQKTNNRLLQELWGMRISNLRQQRVALNKRLSD